MVFRVNSNVAGVTLVSPTDDNASGTDLKTASSTNGKITATSKISVKANLCYQAKSVELINRFKADNEAVFNAGISGRN